MDLPLWLSENAKLPSNSRAPKPRKKHSFIQKTLAGIIRIIQDSVFSEEIACRDGFLQRLDPRLKSVSFFLLLLSINLIRDFSLIWGFYVLLLALAGFSAIPLKALLKRVWLVIPLFTGIMVFPALFNWVRPGDPLWIIWDFGQPVQLGPFDFPQTLTITKQGFWGDVLIISRVGISVSLALILTMTTRWNDLLRALRAFFVPKIIIATLEMTYRYIFVLLTIVEEMFLARKARDAGNSNSSEHRRFIAASISSLFGKSLQMSDDIYASMQARGYNGEIHTANRFHISWQDLFFLAACLLVSLILYAADKVVGG